MAGGLADIDSCSDDSDHEGARDPSSESPARVNCSNSFPTRLPHPSEAAQLRRAYGFLRSLETFARIDADTNLSVVPDDAEMLDALGRRLQLADPPAQSLRETYQRETESVRAIYESVVARLG